MCVGWECMNVGWCVFFMSISVCDMVSLGVSVFGDMCHSTVKLLQEEHTDFYANTANPSALLCTPHKNTTNPFSIWCVHVRNTT